MHTRRFEWKAPAMLFMVASVALAGACIAIEHAYAQGVNATPHAQGRNPFAATSSPLLNRAPSMPPSAFNPSSPYTVSQSRESPVSPASPGSVFGSSPNTGGN
jgi:hypothetical protein